MAKYELTIATGYVSDWTTVEAVRELFQNALDNQTVNPTNQMFFDYLPDEQILRIGNATSQLGLETLLLGATTKLDDPNTIGKHGEGYKIALMVLLREGKHVVIYNYGNRQVWTARLKNSRRFNGSRVPEISVDRKYVWQKVPDQDLLIEIKGIAPEEYEAIRVKNLHLQGSYDSYRSCRDSDFLGEILVGEHHVGKFYVNGLYITTNSNFKYGYNFPPSAISLDRDRRLLDTIDLGFQTSKVWRYADLPGTLATLLLEGAYDVKYVEQVRPYIPEFPSTTYEVARSRENDIDHSISSRLTDEFHNRYGDDAYAVASTDDLSSALKSHVRGKPAVVSHEIKSYLKVADAAVVFSPKTPKALLEEWMERVESCLSEEDIADFYKILSDI